MHGLRTHIIFGYLIYRLRDIMKVEKIALPFGPWIMTWLSLLQFFRTYLLTQHKYPFFCLFVFGPKTLRIIYKNKTSCIQISRYEITIASLSFGNHTYQMHNEKNNLKCWVYFHYASSIKICKLWSQCAGNHSTKMCNESCYYKCGSCIGTAVTAWYSLTLVQL